MKKKFTFGFTLAEVLITLGIIGIVAALTIPNMMVRIRNVKYESGFKKAYNNLSIAVQKAASDVGENILGNYTLGTSPSISDIIASQFPNSDNSKRTCGIEYYKNDGVTVMDQGLYDDGCIVVNPNFFIHVNNDTYSLTSIQLMFDTNGEKKPNREGYDFFIFQLDKNNKLVPMESANKAINEKDYFKNLK